MVPILVVEVVSPATARYDRTIKRALYQRVGVTEYGRYFGADDV